MKNNLVRKLTTLKGMKLQPKIEDLSRSRVAVNNALFDVARKNLKVISEDGKSKGRKRKAPFVYLSIFKGEDPSVLKDGIANPDMVRTCEFRYIPAGSFTKILNNLLDDSTSSFGDVVGVSGRTYTDLQTAAIEIGDAIEKSQAIPPPIELPTFPLTGGDKADAVDLILEFFPIINLSETTLSSTTSNPVIGGYYTVIDNTLYLKMPDISGRDSAGKSNGLRNS